MSSEELQNYLKQQAGTGAESAGTFTLDPQKALEKLAKYQLPEPGLWVVKLVQAGVCFRVDKIHVTLSRHAVRLRFEGGPQFRSSEILTALISGESLKGGMGSLVAGLRAVLGQQPRSLRLSDNHEGSIWLKGQNVERSSATVADSLAIAVEIKRVPANFSRLRFLLGQSVVEHRALCKHCEITPIPVILDGRTISRQLAREEGEIATWVVENACPSTFFLGDQLSTVDYGPHCRVPATDLKDPYIGAIVRICSAVQGDGSSPPKASKSECQLVKDGVLIETRTLDFPSQNYRLKLTLGADEVAYDLSGFSLAKFEFPIDEIRKTLWQMVEAIYQCWPVRGDRAVVRNRGDVSATLLDLKDLRAAIADFESPNW